MTVYIDGVMGFIRLLVTRRLFQTSIGEKETKNIYVDIIITLNLFLSYCGILS